MRRYLLVFVCIAMAAPGCADSRSIDVFEWTTAPVDLQRANQDPVVLRNVRTEQQQRFDRLVFEFANAALPGYRIAYADGPARECGTGNVVAVEGATTLLVRLSPAQAHTEDGTVTIRAARQRLELPVLRDMHLLCDFEGEVAWAFGVGARNGYRVSEFSDPARVVIDVQH